MAVRKRAKRYGLVLVDRDSKLTLVLWRINYGLYDRINNNLNGFINSAHHKDILQSMSPGFFHESMYEFPKGVRDKNETGLQSAVREFHEETGIFLNISHLNIFDEVKQTYGSFLV